MPLPNHPPPLPPRYTRKKRRKCVLEILSEGVKEFWNVMPPRQNVPKVDPEALERVNIGSG